MKIIINDSVINLEDEIPNEWKEGINAKVYVHAYKIFTCNICNGINKFMLGDAMIFLFYGKFDYIDSKNNMHKIQNGNMKFIDPEIITSENDIYLFLITPNKDENLIKSKLGLLNAFFGKNITCEYIFNNFIFVNDLNKGSVTSYKMTNYFKLKPVDLSKTSINIIIDAFDSRLTRRNGKVNKILYSLTWFFEAINNEEDEKNRFIKYWIAIETLTMNNTKRFPIGKILGNIYSMDSSSAIVFFQVENIYKIRCKMVHSGKLIKLDSKILAYIQDLYVDLLFYKIKIKSQFKAKNYIDQGLNICDYLRR